MKNIPWILAVLVMLPTLWAADVGLYELSEDFHPTKQVVESYRERKLGVRDGSANSILRIRKSFNMTEQLHRCSHVVTSLFPVC